MPLYVRKFHDKCSININPRTFGLVENFASDYKTLWFKENEPEYFDTYVDDILGLRRWSNNQIGYGHYEQLTCITKEIANMDDATASFDNVRKLTNHEKNFENCNKKNISITAFKY